ncbi:hypothetical protein FB004_12413 [Sinorhizobium medicae]|nr:hypothetical protein FB004_12413 [Sinorhizobium medicae]
MEDKSNLWVNKQILMLLSGSWMVGGRRPVTGSEGPGAMIQGRGYGAMFGVGPHRMGYLGPESAVVHGRCSCAGRGGPRYPPRHDLYRPLSAGVRRAGLAVQRRTAVRQASTSPEMVGVSLCTRKCRLRDLNFPPSKTDDEVPYNKSLDRSCGALLQQNERLSTKLPSVARWWAIVPDGTMAGLCSLISRSYASHS